MRKNKEINKKDKINNREVQKSLGSKKNNVHTIGMGIKEFQALYFLQENKSNSGETLSKKPGLVRGLPKKKDARDEVDVSYLKNLKKLL